MTDQSWKWYVGPDESEFDDVFKTRDAAVAEARARGGAWIIHAVKEPVQLSLFFYIEALPDAVNDEYAQDDPIWQNVTQAQADELQDSIRATIDAWQAAHNIVLLPCTFSDSTPAEWIDEC